MANPPAETASQVAAGIRGFEGIQSEPAVRLHGATIPLGRRLDPDAAGANDKDALTQPHVPADDFLFAAGGEQEISIRGRGGMPRLMFVPAQEFGFALLSIVHMHF